MVVDGILENEKRREYIDKASRSEYKLPQILSTSPHGLAIFPVEPQIPAFAPSRQLGRARASSPEPYRLRKALS